MSDEQVRLNKQNAPGMCGYNCLYLRWDGTHCSMLGKDLSELYTEYCTLFETWRIPLNNSEVEELQDEDDNTAFQKSRLW